MDNNEEYHDPDYPGTSMQTNENPPSLSQEEREEKIRNIINREFKNELDVRENEVMLADQRMATARRMLHRLRYALVSQYYRDQKLQLPEDPTEPEATRGQRRLHPSVRKLLGKRTADMDEIFRPLATRHKRKDYSAMVQARDAPPAGSAGLAGPAGSAGSAGPAGSSGSAGPAGSSGSAGPAPPPPPAHAPRRLQPRRDAALTLDEATRNKMKHRYRLIVGNTSKYAPAASAADRSTHKWLLYVRGAGGADAARLLRAVTVTLHHSYAPHHVVHVDKPPFHVSRRGWGEFPAKVELHFRLPDRNRPATVEHSIRLDRHYTGLQTLGAETLVDVWLYSTPDMLEFEFKEEQETLPPAPAPAPLVPKPEPAERRREQQPAEPPHEREQDQLPGADHTDNWLDFFTSDTKLDVDEMIIKPTKKQENHIENNMELDFDVDIKPDILQLEKTVKMEQPVVKVEPEIADVKLEQDTSGWDVEAEIIPNEILKQPPSPKKRIMKYLDQKTGKIYYLEMDRKLDLSKVQEIVINSKGNVKTAKLSPVKPVNGKVKKGQSLLKPEIKNMLNKKVRIFTHITNDHCYLGSSWVNSINFSVPEVKSEVVKKERTLYACVCAAVERFTCVRVAVNYMLKKIPIITEEALDPEFKRCFPFVETDERFWKMDFAKRRNKEWSRAKLINTILQKHFKPPEPIWRTKQILIFARLHGYQPVRKDMLPAESSWDDLEPDTEVSTLSVFNIEEFNKSITESIDLSDDDEVEVVKSDVPVKVQVKKEPEELLTVIPVESEEDRLRFLFIERICADIGIELRNEDVGHGYSYSAVHAVLLSALRSFAEELVRGALAEGRPPPSVWAAPGAPAALAARQVRRGARGRLAAVTRRDTAAPRRDTHHAI